MCQKMNGKVFTLLTMGAKHFHFHVQLALSLPTIWNLQDNICLVLNNYCSDHVFFFFLKKTSRTVNDVLLGKKREKKRQQLL